MAVGSIFKTLGSVTPTIRGPNAVGPLQRDLDGSRSFSIGPNAVGPIDETLAGARAWFYDYPIAFNDFTSQTSFCVSYRVDLLAESRLNGPSGFENLLGSFYITKGDYFENLLSELYLLNGNTYDDVSSIFSIRRAVATFSVLVLARIESVIHDVTTP